MTVFELVLLVLAAACFGATTVGIPSGKATNLLGAGALLVTLVLIMQGLPLAR